MMDSDKKQLLLNINGESEVVVTRRRVRQPIWALAIAVFLLIAIAIGGVLVLCKVFLDWSDTTELSFSTATVSGKRQNVTVNVDKKWVQYHVLGDAISKQPEVLTVHDFHWNLHVIKVIDVENSNQSKCFVGSLDRRTFPSPTDIMQFATDDSIDIEPMELKLHYEGYDWLNIELSLLGPIYHKLCHGVETAYIFPAYDDADLLLDAPSGQLSLSASSPLDEERSSPVLYTFSYVIDHHQEDARKKVRLERAVTLSPYQLVASRHSFNRYNAPSWNQNRNGIRVRRQVDETPSPEPWYGLSAHSPQLSVYSLGQYRNQRRRTREADDEQIHHQEGASKKVRLERSVPLQRYSRHSLHRYNQPSSNQNRNGTRVRRQVDVTPPPYHGRSRLSLNRYKNQPRRTRDVDDEQSHQQEGARIRVRLERNVTPSPSQKTAARSAHSLNRYRNQPQPRRTRDVDDEQSHHRSRRSAQPDEQDHTDDYDDSTTDEDTDDEVPPPQPPRATPNNRPGSTDGASERSALSLIRYRPRGRREVDDEQSHHRSRRSAQSENQDYLDELETDVVTDDEWSATPNNQPPNPGSPDGTSVRGRLSPGTRYQPRGRGSG